MRLLTSAPPYRPENGRQGDETNQQTKLPGKMFADELLDFLMRRGRAGIQLGQFDRKVDLSSVFVRELLMEAAPEEREGVIGGLGCRKVPLRFYGILGHSK